VRFSETLLGTERTPSASAPSQHADSVFAIRWERLQVTSTSAQVRMHGEHHIRGSGARSGSEMNSQKKKGRKAVKPIALERHHEGVGGNPPLGGSLHGEEGINLRAVLPCS
jgi:hypothetical protein